MPIRIRKLIGTFALFALVIVWALLAMAIAQFALPIFNNPLGRRDLFYVVAGLGWVLPAMPLDDAGCCGRTRSQADVDRGRKPFHSAVAAPDISTLA